MHRAWSRSHMLSLRVLNTLHTLSITIGDRERYIVSNVWKTQHLAQRWCTCMGAESLSFGKILYESEESGFWKNIISSSHISLFFAVIST